MNWIVDDMSDGPRSIATLSTISSGSNNREFPPMALGILEINEP